MNIIHISDTHGFHKYLDTKNYHEFDTIIHSGDASNNKMPVFNQIEMWDFIHWYSKLPIKNKIFVAGNHDTSVEKGLISKEDFYEMGIIYLEHSEIIIDSIKFFGSPYTPSFNDWAFNKPRHKLDLVWQSIPKDADVVITHGPPKTILDLSYSKDNKLEFCGCKSLYNHIIRVNPRLHCFGHIHSVEDIINSGKRLVGDRSTIFSNGSVVTDNRFGQLSSQGNIFTI